MSKGVLIGAGYFAQFHAEGWQRIPGVLLAAVADPAEDRRREFAARWGIPSHFGSAQEMLERERPDFVDIATRPDTHLELTRLAAGMGVHVICQKPMAPSVEACVEMVRICREAGVRLIVHENWRWQPWYREIRRQIDTGRFGRVFHVGFHMRTGDGRGPEPYSVQPYFREMPRLLIYETLVHYLDTFRYLAGEIEALYCTTERVNPAIRGEDYAVIQLRFAGGARGLIDANRISGDMPMKVAFGDLRLDGDRGWLRMNPEGDLWLAAHGEPETPHVFDKPACGYKGDSVRAFQAHAAACLRSGEPAESEGADYLRTVAAVEACYRSAASGREEPRAVSRRISIALLPGDGIGPEVVAQAVDVLRAVESRMGEAAFAFEELSVGAGEYLRSGDPLPPATFDRLREFDAILLGAMGLPDVRRPDGVEMTPQLDLREKLDLYNGLRPIYLFHGADSPLAGRAAGDIDFTIVRESTEGLFSARLAPATSPEYAEDRMLITRRGSERVIRAAFREAGRRRGHLTLVDKANVLPSMAFFRKIFDEIAPEYPTVRTSRVYVDAAALYMVQRPEMFDTIVTENMFGDILSDLAAGLVGGMGMAPSGDIGGRYAVFQPSHGSAPDIAGRGKANPVAAILSAAMMLEWLEHPGAAIIRDAVRQVFADRRSRTPDMGGTMTTREMGQAIVGQTIGFRRLS